jgi:hypothetical protein
MASNSIRIWSECLGKVMRVDAKIVATDQRILLLEGISVAI